MSVDPPSVRGLELPLLQARWLTMTQATQAIGWLSSLVLLATIVAQIRTQLKERSQRGVSRWLFVGQTVASVGFTIYSVLVRNWVFVVTNAALLVAGLTGVLLTRFYARQSQRAPIASRKVPTGQEVRPTERHT